MPKKYKRHTKTTSNQLNQPSQDQDQLYSSSQTTTTQQQQQQLYANTSAADQQSKDTFSSAERTPKYDSPTRLRSGTNPHLAGMHASPRTRYATMAYRTLAQEEAALVKAQNQRWGRTANNVADDDQMETAVISGKLMPQEYKYSNTYVRSSLSGGGGGVNIVRSSSSTIGKNEQVKRNVEIEKLFQGMIEDHAGMVRSRCSALEQNCKNLQNSRLEIANQFKSKTDKLSQDIQSLQRKHAESDSQLSLVKKNNLIQKQALKNQLLQSNNSRHKTLATLKHNEKLASDQITLKNQRIDQLTSALESLTHSTNSKDRDSTSLRIQLENLKIDLQRLNSQQVLSHIFIADLENAQNRARLSERTIRQLRDQILLHQGESASKSLLLQEQRDHIRELSLKIKDKQIDAELHQKMMDCVLWSFLAQRFLTDNRPAITELKRDLGQCQEELSRLDRLTQSHEPERKAKLTSDIRWCRSRTDDIEGDTIDLEQQFVKLRSKADNAWENPRSLETLRGKGKALVSDLTQFTRITQEVMYRTGKTRDDLQNVKGNLKQLQALLVQVYATRVTQKIVQIKQVMTESSKKQDEIKVNFEKLEQKLKKKNQIRSSGRNDAHKLLIQISNQMDHLINSHKNVANEFEKLESGTVLGLEIQSKEAQLQHDLLKLSDLLNKKTKDCLNTAIDNLRESDLIHANIIDCIQKADAICNNTLKQLIQKMRGELDARSKDHNSLLNQVKQLENSQNLADKNLQQKIQNMNQYDEQRIKANELQKFFDPSCITQMKTKLKNLQSKYKQADFQFKKLNPKGSPGLTQVIHAHDAIEKLNTECDMTSAYISKIYRQYQPMQQQVQDLDIRVKLEQLYRLQSELFQVQQNANDLKKKLRECDDLKSKADALREQLQSAHGYGDAEKHEDVNSLAQALQHDGVDLAAYKNQFEQISNLLIDEQKMIYRHNNDQVIGEQRNYFDNNVKNIQTFRNQIESLIASCNSLKRGLQGGQVQAMALERKYDRKRVKVNNCKRLRERVSVSFNNISANISSLSGRLLLIRKMIVQQVPPYQEGGRVTSSNSPSKGKAADTVRLGELHQTLKQYQEHHKQLQKESNNANEELRNIQNALNKIPREVTTEKELDNHYSSIASLQQLSKRLRNQIRDIQIWLTDSQQVLEPILKTLIGNEDVADAKLLFLQINRQLNDTESRLLEFNEGMQSFPSELEETKSQSERHDTLLKQNIEEMQQRHSALTKILQTCARSVEEQQKQINSLNREINNESFFTIEKNRLFVIRNSLDELDARLRETSLGVGKGLRQYEGLKEELNKIQISYISRQEKISEMLLVIERVQNVKDRVRNDLLPQMERGISDQLALCEVIGTQSGNRDYIHQYLIVEVCKSDMTRFQDWKGRLTKQIVQLQNSDLNKLINIRQNASSITETQASQSLQQAKAVLGRLMFIQMMFHFFNSQILIWRDCETDFRIPTTLQQRDLEVTNASDKIGYIEHQIQNLHEAKSRMTKLGCEVKTDLDSVREKSQIALQNEYRKKIDELKEKILKIINNAKQHDFMTQQIPIAIPFITQLSILNADFLQLDASLQHSIKALDSAKVKANQIIKEQQARIASSNNFQMRDMQQRMLDMEKELQQLRKKNQFLNLMHSIVGPCDINLRSLQGAKRDIEQSNKRLVVITQYSKNRQQQRCMNLTSEGASANSTLNTLDDDIHQMTNRINPLKQAIDGVDFSQDTSSEKVRDAIANLVKMIPHAKILDDRTKKLTTRGGVFKSDVNALESRLLEDFRKELDLRTGSDQNNLNKNSEKLVQCNNLCDKLGENIALKLVAIDPNSGSDQESFNNLRVKLVDKVKVLKGCEKKQFRTEAENKRLRDKLDDPLPLYDIPTLSRAVDIDLAENTTEIDKNIRATDSLFDQLRIMMKDYTIAENGLARSKLDELEERMAEKKKQQRDMGDKLVDIDRELNLLLANLDQSRKAASDNPELRKRLDAMEMMIRDKLKREHARLKGEHDKLAQELSALDKKLDKERTNPTVSGLHALGQELKKHDEAFDVVMEDIDNLKDKVSPLSMEMGEIQRNFGDLLFQVERSIKLGNDDLRDLAKRLKQVQRVLSEVDASRKSLAKDGFKDAEKRRDLQGFARTRQLPLLNTLKSLNADKDSLTLRLDNFRSRLDQHSKSSANKRPNMQQIAKLAREAKSLDEQIRSKQSEANELLSNAELCRDDMKQLVTSYEKKAQEYSDTLAEAQDCRSRLNSVDTTMESLRSRLIVLTETISDTPKAKSQQSLLVRDQLMRDAQSLRVKINDANNMQQKMQNDYELHTKDLPQIETKIITVIQLKSKRQQLRKLIAKLLQFERDLAQIDRKMKQATETAENQHRRQKNEQLYDVERRAKNQEEQLKRADSKLQRLGVLLNDLQRDAENEQRTNPNNPIMYDSMRDLLNQIMHIKNNTPSLSKEHSTLRTIVSDILNQLTLLSPRTINPQSLSKFSDSLDDVEPRTVKLHSDIDGLLKLSDRLNDRVIHAKQDAADRIEKNNKLVNDLGKSQQSNSNLKSNLALLKELIDDIRLISKAMTHNPDYQDDIGDVGNLTSKLNKSEQSYEQISKQHAQLTLKLQEILKAEKTFAIEEEPVIQEYLISVGEILPLLEGYEAQTDELIQSLKKKRAKMGDLKIPENIEKRKHEGLELQHCINQCENEIKQLSQKLKYHDEFCDLPGERDDMIRDMVRKDIEKGSGAVAEARVSRESSLRDLAKVNNSLEGKNLLILSGHDSHKPILTIAQIGERLRKTIENLKDVIMQLSSGKDNLGDLDVEKKMFDMETEMKDIDSNILNIQKDLELLEEVIDVLENDYQDKDQEKLHLVLKHDVDIISANCSDLKNDSKTLCRDFERMRNSLERSRGDNSQMMLLIRELNTLDARIGKNRAKLNDTEKLLNKSKDRVAIIDLEAKQKVRNNQMSHITLKIEEGNRDIQQLRQFAQQQVNEPNDYQQQIAQLQAELQNTSALYQELSKQKLGLKNDLNKIADVLKALKKPRNFYQVQPPYVGYKHVGKRIRWILSKLLQFDKRLEKTKNAREKIINSKQRINYRAQKGDPVDRMLADFLNAYGCPVPITRIGGGFYMFGTRKIYAKIINGRLVIRVGGGYMNIQEFVAHHAQQELMKMQLAQTKSIEFENSPRNQRRGSKMPRKSMVGKFEEQKSTDGRRMTKSTSAGNVGRVTIQQPEDLEKMLREYEKNAAMQGDSADFKNIGGKGLRTPR